MGVTQNFTYADRVKETTATTGTGDYILGGAVTSFQAFADALSDGAKLYYAISDGAEFEVGIGSLTIGSPDNSISRESILSSSNGGAAVSWGAGSKEIFLTAPANIFDSGLLWEYEVTGAAETSIDTGSILDINTHKSYRIEIDWYNPTGTGSNLSCFANGDTTAANYRSQLFQISGSTPTGSLTSSATITTANSGVSNAVTVDIRLVPSGADNFMHAFTNAGNVTSGTSVIIQMRHMNHIASQSNITQLTFTASTASSLGIGSKIRIYRGDR
jgi:hypothetical protein